MHREQTQRIKEYFEKKAQTKAHRRRVLGFGLLTLAVLSVLAYIAYGKATSTVAQTSSNLVINNYYIVISQSKTLTEQTALLEYRGSSSFYGNPSSPIIKRLNLSISYQNTGLLNIKISDADSKRWEIPHREPFSFVDPKKRMALDKGNCKIEITEKPFALKVSRKVTGEVLFDTNGTDFIYSHLYLELSTSIPNDNIFGWGERAYKMNLGPYGNFTLWNKDLPGLIEQGTPGGNGYGFHPYYLLKGNKGNFDLIYLRTTNAMQVAVQGNLSRLTMQVTGGVLDFVFFFGDQNPETAIRKYHEFLGEWQMPPFWALGWQQSKWGYHYLNDVKEILDNYTHYQLPIDVIWSDLDYMTDFLDFTVDNERFPNNKFKDLLEKAGKKWVPIVDAGIGISDNDGYNRGKELDLFIKNNTGQDFTGIVWPGNVHFPDFFHPNATQYWMEMLDIMYKKVPFSGIWIDMNEIANFCDGDCAHTEPANGQGKYDSLPFCPSEPSLFNRTVSLDSTHNLGNNETVDEYYVHPLFAYLEAQATHKYLKTKSNLTFVLSRSTYSGIGKYTNHWLGDVWTTWEFLQLALPGIMSMNLNGIPLVGSDICGFIHNTTADLCVRWMQIGVLYPFARNHHENETMSQEPWVLGPTVLETSKVSLQLRYSILKYYYAQFIERRGSGTIFRPLFFEFPEDKNLFNHSKKITDEQILIGRGLMAAPVLYPDTSIVHVYFPQANWFDFITGDKMHDAKELGKSMPVHNPANTTVPLYIRGGTIIQKQNITNVSSSADLNNTFELIIAFDYEKSAHKYTAKGFTLGVKNYSHEQTVYEKCVVNNCLLDIQAEVHNGTLQVKVEAQDSQQAVSLDKIVINKLTLYGLDKESTGLSAKTQIDEWKADVIATPQSYVVTFSAQGKKVGNGDEILIKLH